MKALGIIALVLGLTVFSIGGCTVVTVLGTLNSEAQLKNGVKAQENVREAFFDKMAKKITQGTQITKASTTTQKELVKLLIEGRSATFIKIVNESNPAEAFSRSQYDKLYNTIEAERDGFFREQKALTSKYQEYANLYDQPVSGFVLKITGKQQYPEPMVISSDEAKAVRESGKDNKTELNL